jgi:hypothetical protein
MDYVKLSLLKNGDVKVTVRVKDVPVERLAEMLKQSFSITAEVRKEQERRLSLPQISN